MSIGNIFIIIGTISFPIIGCLFGMLAIRYSVNGLQQGNKKLEIIKVLTSNFAYVSTVLWIIIYASVGYASYRVFNCFQTNGNGFEGIAKLATALYIIQLILYWAWLPIFIKFEPCIGLVIWAAALLTATGCGIAFGFIDLIAGLIFIPYVICMLLFTASLSGILCIACSFGMLGDIIGEKRTNNDLEQSTNI